MVLIPQPERNTKVMMKRNYKLREGSFVDLGLINTSALAGESDDLEFFSELCEVVRLGLTSSIS